MRLNIITIGLASCALLFIDQLSADKPIPEKLHQKSKVQDDPLPWFTGPLITPSGTTIPKGHYNIEPYVYYNTIYGSYDSNRNYVSAVHLKQLQFQIPLQFGVGENLEFDVTPGIQYAYQSGVNATQLMDTTVNVSTQLLDDKTDTIFPGIKLTLSEVFPTGKYRNFNANKTNVEASGQGAFTTFGNITFSKLFKISDERYFAYRSNIAYGISSTVPVKGFHAYGGGFGTSGKIKPGNSFNWQTGFEINITKHWVLALDTVYVNQSKSTFSGTQGIDADGNTAENGSGYTETYSLAPAIEYNYNSHIGVILGSWFSVGGKNSSAYANAVGALNIYY